MVKWRYDEFFDLLEMPCTGFFFFPNSVFMIFFILFYFPFIFFLSFFFFFLPDHILQRWYTYLRFTGQDKNGSHFHNTSQRDSYFLPAGSLSGAVGASGSSWGLHFGQRSMVAPAASGRNCSKQGHWLPFGLRCPFHSGKNALVQAPVQEHALRLQALILDTWMTCLWWLCTSLPAPLQAVFAAWWPSPWWCLHKTGSSTVLPSPCRLLGGQQGSHRGGCSQNPAVQNGHRLVEDQAWLCHCAPVARCQPSACPLRALGCTALQLLSAPQQLTMCSLRGVEQKSPPC